MRTLAIVTFAVIAIALPSAALPELGFEGGIAFDAAPKGDRGSMKYLGPQQPVFVTGSISNKGNARATSILVELIINNRIIGRALLGELKAGGSGSYSIKWIPETADTYHITVKIDPSGSVREEDRTNNMLQEQITIRYNVPTAEMTGDNIPRPDLQLPSFSVSPNPIVARLSSIACDVHNSGDAVAENVDVTIMMDGARFATKTIGPIPPESSLSVTFSWTPHKRGNVKIQAQADMENKIMESDESNNSAEKTMEAKR
ncbi:MAG: CARDB domain-containing protein [Candidatus Hydrogenedentota bacterium]